MEAYVIFIDRFIFIDALMNWITVFVEKASKTSKATSKPSNLETNLFKIYYKHYVFENNLKKKYLFMFLKIRILKKKKKNLITLNWMTEIIVSFLKAFSTRHRDFNGNINAEQITFETWFERLGIKIFMSTRFSAGGHDLSNTLVPTENALWLLYYTRAHTHTHAYICIFL